MTGYTKAGLEAALLQICATMTGTTEMPKDLPGRTLMIAAYAHAGLIVLREADDAAIKAAVGDLAQTGCLVSEGPLSAMSARQAALMLADECFARLTGVLEDCAASEWTVSMEHGTPSSWVVRRKFTHVRQGVAIHGQVQIRFDVEDRSIRSVLFWPGDDDAHSFYPSHVRDLLLTEAYDPYAALAETDDEDDPFRGLSRYALAMIASDAAFERATEELGDFGSEDWIVESDEGLVELSCVFRLQSHSASRRETARFVTVFDTDRRALCKAGFEQPGGPVRWLDEQELAEVMKGLRI